ncbi:MAG: hypothetical protein PWP11_883 [Thauera sp.]|nr:winged helix-turn-helix domain-containing protein [Thauera sp.]MDI3489606.1 hypothetical protein [Thauera sp.]
MNLRFEILKAVAANPGAPINEIADAISYDRQKTAWSVRDCAQDGLLAKRLDDVTRQPGYTLTDAGKKRLAEGPAKLQGGNLKKGAKTKTSFNAGPRDRAEANAKVEAVSEPAAAIPAPENYSLLGVLADIREAVGDPTGKLMLSELAEHIRLRLAELDATPATLRAELKKADDELAEIQAALAGRVYIVGDLDELPSAAQCATRAAAVIDQLTSANREMLNMIAIASETLAPLASGDIDTSDMDLHELAEQAAARIAAKDSELLALSDTITQRNAELSNGQALVEKLEHLLQSARNEAEHLRRHVTHNEDGLDGQPLGNLLMGAREFLEVGQRVTVTGGEAKVEVRALNITFDLAPHEVSEVLEHATALERKLPVPF